MKSFIAKKKKIILEILFIIFKTFPLILIFELIKAANKKALLIPKKRLQREVT